MIVVPYTDLSPLTAEAVPDARFVRVEPEHGYRLLLAELWREGAAFTLVEHDVIPTQAQLDALESCDRPWCFHGYFPGHWVPVFGCARFSADLIAGTSGIWDDASWPWCQLDMKFATVARAQGWTPHWHSPHVRHGGTEFVTSEGASKGELPAWLLEYTLGLEHDKLQALGAI